jgi:hypothetical protein
MRPPTHQASLADERGGLVWSGHRFGTTATDLERLWSRLPAGHRPEDSRWWWSRPATRGWLAAWFRRKGAQVVLVSAERSAGAPRALYVAGAPMTTVRQAPVKRCQQASAT